VPFAWAAALRLPPTLEPVLAARRGAGPSLGEASGARIHEVRIAAKRARYAFDACVPALGKPGKRFAKRLRAFADEAGELHDAEGHAAAVRDLAHAVPRLAGERTAAERAAALLGEAFDARAKRGREAIDALYDAALGPASIRALLCHLAKRVAARR
jgi:CHAD domain-containing protein